MKVVTVDFETYWTTEYSLSKMTCEEYVRHEDFKAHMVGVKVDTQPTLVLTPAQAAEVLPKMPWGRLGLLCQNTQFDGFILAEHYGVVPKFYLDTMSMFRALAPHKRASLKSISDFLELSQAKGGQTGYSIVNTRGKRELTPYEWKSCAAYCALDCDLTWEAWQKMKPEFPLEELRIIDQNIRFFTQPSLILNPEPLEAEVIFEREKKAELISRIGGDVKQLGSSPKFALLLESLNVVPPVKPSPAALKKDPDLKDVLEALDLPQEAYTPALLTEYEIPWSYAFGKNDKGMLALQNHDDPLVVAAVEARLGVKSTLAQTRAARLLAASSRGPYPVALNYAAAHTLRDGGCVVDNTEVIVYDWACGVTHKLIVDVLPDDLVWDGEEFVAHQGVKFRGYREVITYDGITGTTDHPVFQDEDTTIPLAEAMRTGTRIMEGREPTERDVETLRHRA